MPALRTALLNFAAVSLGIALTAPGIAQTHPGPIYTLPPDGTWVEYDWHGSTPDGKKQGGLLRISSVGRKLVGNAPHRWVEIKLEDRTGQPPAGKLRKLLIDEADFRRSGSLAGQVVEAFSQSLPGGPVKRVVAADVDSFLKLGLETTVGPLAEVRARQEIETGLGKLTARQVRIRGKAGTRGLEYNAWLSAEVPFGWAKAEVADLAAKPGAPPRFAATAVRTGDGAKSELDESLAK